MPRFEPESHKVVTLRSLLGQFQQDSKVQVQACGLFGLTGLVLQQYNQNGFFHGSQRTFH
jgi:hypothetical protein